MQFQISWLKKGKVGKYIPDLLRSEFLQKFSANKTTPSGHWTEKVYIADLALLSILSAVCQKSWDSSFWEVILSC